MGNYVSCTFATPLIKNGKAARVILPSGEVRQFGDPTKAAELMLECPNFFLANVLSLHIGRRFSALSADEELELGNVYVMFPMKRVGSVVAAADMALLFMAANSASKRVGDGNIKHLRVLGERSKSGELLEWGREKWCDNNGCDVGDGRQRLSLEGRVDEGFPMVPEMMKYRVSICRSRKPLLETIKEEPVCSR